MKKMNCKQLGGACELEFQAESFDEMAELSKQHGMEMYQKQDPAHLAAMQKMQTMANNPQAMDQWFEARRQEFDALPNSD